MKKKEPISSILPFLLDVAKVVLVIHFLLTPLSTFLDSCAYNLVDTLTMVTAVAIALVCIVAQLLVSKARLIQANTFLNVKGWANVIDETVDIINAAEEELVDAKLKNEAVEFLNYIIRLGRSRPIEHESATLLRTPEVKYFCDARDPTSKVLNTYGAALLVLLVTLTFTASICYLPEKDACVFFFQTLRSLWLVFMTSLLVALIMTVASFRNKFGCFISQTFWSHAWHKDADLKGRIFRVALAARHHVFNNDKTLMKTIMWLRSADTDS